MDNEKKEIRTMSDILTEKELKECKFNVKTAIEMARHHLPELTLQEVCQLAIKEEIEEIRRTLQYHFDPH